MLRKSGSYQEVINQFQWQVPTVYNIATDVCDKHAGSKTKLALICQSDETSNAIEISFQQLKKMSDQLASSFRSLGIVKMDRIGIVLTQRVEAALTHLAAFKLGAITVPMFTLLGPDALEYRLAHSGTKLIVVDEKTLPKIVSIKNNLPDLETIVVVANTKVGEFHLFDELLSSNSTNFRPAATIAEDPALLIYTSGTTGSPKGALHAHRSLLGHLPGAEFANDFMPQPGDRFWTPSDWAWVAGLMDVLLPAWHHGLPVVASDIGKFDPEKAYSLLERHQIRNVLIPPTALKMMREIPNPQNRYSVNLRTVFSGGEPLGAELLEWAENYLNVNINEVYGQTEANLIVGSCHQVMDVKPGSMGKPIPGHNVAIIRDDGSLAPTNEVGEIGIAHPDPVMFLEYWNDPNATRDKFKGVWALTGDLGKIDSDGYFWFIGRRDDLITTSGYRIGPVEIENSILKHPDVSMVAVIGVPNPLRGHIIKAFVKTKAYVQPSNELAKSIQELVKKRLGAHQYPRDVSFVKSLPTTASGKIIRKELRRLEQKQYDKKESHHS